MLISFNFSFLYLIWYQLANSSAIYSGSNELLNKYEVNILENSSSCMLLLKINVHSKDFIQQRVRNQFQSEILTRAWDTDQMRHNHTNDMICIFDIWEMFLITYLWELATSFGVICTTKKMYVCLCKSISMENFENEIGDTVL